jgi:hypothetical protein
MAEVLQGTLRCVTTAGDEAHAAVAQGSPQNLTKSDLVGRGLHHALPHHRCRQGGGGVGDAAAAGGGTPCPCQSRDSGR